MEMVYSKELGLTTLPPSQQASHDMFTMSDALALYHRLKGKGKAKLFFEASERSMRYLSECLGHENLTALEISDAGRFRDYLFGKGMSSSSVKRALTSSLRRLGQSPLSLTSLNFLCVLMITEFFGFYMKHLNQI